MIRLKKGSVEFILANWKTFIHLLLRTRHLGVNNKWWQRESGFMGLALYKIIFRIILVYPLIREYWAIRFRATHNYFLGEEELNLLGWSKENSPGFFTILTMRNPISLVRWTFRRVFK